MSDSLWPHGLQHTRLPCPSPTPRVYSNSCPLSHWCHPTISSSVACFSCPQSFPASGSFPMSWLFTSSGQSIGASAPSLPMNIQYSGFISFRIDCFDLLAVQGTLKSLLYSVQFSSVAQSCPTLCDPMNCSTPGLSVHLLKGKDSGFLCHLSCSLSYWNLDSRLFLQNINERQFSSVQFSRSVMSYSLWPCELQHARPPCPSPTPGVHPNSCPSSQWCHPTISSSVIPFSSCLQSFPTSGCFPMSQFTSGGQVLEFQLQHQSF